MKSRSSRDKERKREIKEKRDKERKREIKGKDRKGEKERMIRYNVMTFRHYVFTT